MTTTQLSKRRSIIISELTKLSYRGWDQCRREDWQPLEQELAELDIIYLRKRELQQYRNSK